VALAATRVPRPAGRGNELRPTAVADAARRLGLPLAEVETVKAGEGFEAIAAVRPDLLVVVAYGEILPKAVLELPRLGAVNVHFSLLPAFRGASPVQYALLGGLGVTGVTTMLLDEGTDTGPILLQREVRIAPDDDAGSLGERLSQEGARLLVQTLDRLASGDVTPRRQDEETATSAPLIQAAERALEWSESADALVRRIRALSPEPGASTHFRGDGLKLLRAESVPGAGVEGVVVDVTKDGFVVGTGAGGLRPLEVLPAGRKRMSGGEFVRGYRPRVGERFG